MEAMMNEYENDGVWSWVNSMSCDERKAAADALRRAVGVARKGLADLMSALGPKQTCRKTQSMSLLGVKRT